jgi:hypothetical protein
MNRFLTRCWIAGLSFAAAMAPAAISMTTFGTGWQTFDQAPSASDWSTLLVPGSSTTVSNGASLDFLVQTFAASNINAAISTTATFPPSTSSTAGARWNPEARFLQTRPAGAAQAILLLATLRNDTGSAVFVVELSIGMQTFYGGSAVRGEVPGYYLYFSLTGEPNSWQPVPSLAGIETNADVSAILPVNSWLPDAPLYVLFAMDNDSGTDPAYTVDNFAAAAGPMHISRPRLAVRRVNGASIELSWPLPATAYSLQFLDDLNRTNWSPGPGTYPNLVFPTNGWHRVQWPQTNSATFFRLVRP